MIPGILDALLEPALLLDPAGRVAMANTAARDRLGVWMMGRSYISVLRQPALLAPVEDAYAHGTEGTARFTQSSGEVDTLYSVRVSPIRAEGERQRHVLLVFRDVSELNAAPTMRRDFVANVSHELKTPLTAVMGFVETLQGPAREDPKGRDRFLALMAQELSRMNRLVSDLLSLSRLEGQSRRRPTGRVDLAELITDLIAALEPGAADNDVDIEFDSPPTAMAPGDRDQLTQVVTNLVENAVKYGARPGIVTVTLRRVTREPVIRGPAWRIAVTDRGAGIPPEHIPRLTERFYRVDTGRSREQGGTGLGLAIVKHIINRHRGRLQITSELGKGTTVTVTLPAEVNA
ncbi:Alkaline phosphatase synthesis sensor protein PhoR [Jannaschia seosinensis]|uniref:histidine kinase n=1 Tax=Jannaschia seosinensis TaxID=313367 RepID=A0A0M7BGE7_9RHOB|nr:ATP-binding protein [Jannaschia seosinensis]CUH40465.1 Alkaline phosphatase synthesis sensor protein PhoR [Jannaschia seosinensis]